MPKSKPKTLAVDPIVSNFFEGIEEGKTVLTLKKDARLFSQGDDAQTIYFIQSGKIKLSIFSGTGKEAVLAIRDPHNFLGEGCLVGQSIRVTNAIAIKPSTVFQIERRAMLRSLRDRPELSEKFISTVLGRNIDLEEHLCKQLFNHTEKRLARVLLKLSRLGRDVVATGAQMPLLSHQTLAEMVGATTSDVTHFMNKFKRMGMVDYQGETALIVRAELLTDVVLQE